MVETLQNSISREMGSLESEENMDFAVALYKRNLKNIDKKTIENLIMGNFRALDKSKQEKHIEKRINDAVKAGILSKNGNMWKVNLEKIEKKYKLLMQPGLCR